jgi:hypothetical protein
MVPALALTQYPIQKVINGDSVVIMTTQQGRDINIKFEKQKKKIAELNKQIDSLKQIQPEKIYISERTNESFYQSKVKKLDTLECWLDNAARKSSIIFYFEGDIVAIDLSDYSLKNIYKGSFHFVQKRPRYLENEFSDEPIRKWELVMMNRKLKYKKLKL